jgi:DNA-binding beta-propeller fold protein YncE
MSNDSVAAPAKSSAMLNKVPLQARGPRFEIDPWWPKPLPEGWIGGQLSGCCVDHKDNVIVTNRGDITKEEEETCIKAPPVMIFDPAGNLVDSWGDWEVMPQTIHSCCVDPDDNVWITANGDGMIQKYTHSGKLLLQIGKKGVFDTDDGTRRGKPLNAGHTAFIKPAGICVDPTNGDVYVADGYGNRRVAVFNSESCANGAARPHPRKWKPASAACSRRWCIA